MKVHLYTLAWNEAEMCRFFFRHYDSFVDHYVIFDDGSTDGTLEVLRAHPRVELRRFARTDAESFVESQRHLQNQVWKESRGKADWVIVTALDEHLHNPQTAMRDYLERLRGDGVTYVPALGYQMVSEEFPEPGNLLCQTCTWGAPFELMSKLSLFMPDAIEETHFDHGRHSANPEGTLVLPAEDELLNLHYKYLGFRRTYERMNFQRGGLGEKDRLQGWGKEYYWSLDRFRAEWESFSRCSVDLSRLNLKPWESHAGRRWWREWARTIIFPVTATSPSQVSTEHPPSNHLELLNSPPIPAVLRFVAPATASEPADSLRGNDGLDGSRDVDQTKIRALEETVQLLQQRLETIERSRWWRLHRQLLQVRSLIRWSLARGHGRGLLRRLLCVLTAPGRRHLRRGAAVFCKHCYLMLEQDPIVILPGGPAVAASSPAYSRWLAMNAPRPTDMAAYREHQAVLPYRPRISIILPVFDPSPAWLRQAVQSVLDQVYPNWELCIADDASTDPVVGKVIAEFSERDSRIRVVRRKANGHISAASNSALSLASGDFCALLDHDDLLAPDALYHNVVALNGQRDLDVLYSDEDMLDGHGRRCEPQFKPQWSPDSLLTGNYVCHFLVARTALVREVGGFREGFEGAQDFDLVLRLSERSQRIRHIPRVLYHWRKHAQSSAQTAAAKPYAYRSGVRALEEALDRRGESGQVIQEPGAAGYYRIRYALKAGCRTNVLIPTRDLALPLRACLSSLLERTDHQDFQVLVIDNGSKEPMTFELFQEYGARYPGRFSVLRQEGPFNFSKLINVGAQATRDPYILLLNNDVEVLETSWLEAMLGQAQRRSVGCVGARLLYPDGTVQHAGVVTGGGLLPVHAFRHANLHERGYANRLQSVTNYSAVTAACLLVRRSIFEEVGGFDEGFAVDWNDIDFCLRVREAGYHNVVVPQATLRHHELLSRGSNRRTPESFCRYQAEAELFRTRWAQYVTCDPCLSPHLAPCRGGLRLAA